MFGSMHTANQAYASVGVQTDVATADPLDLVVMLYDGAILALATARMAIDNNDIPLRGQKISHAIDIITNGLHASLDYQSGGELADRLGALYNYMVSRLIYANLNASAPAIDEVVALLKELKSGWDTIRDQARSR
ncbi:flagellar export chaperone FliS [Niveibacterium terrae]|uniref:flagellar export chaperone FliS n=1 Tax=Niveibacterium terrae TaxID=3373598 RepID=UPI003A8D7065